MSPKEYILFSWVTPLLCTSIAPFPRPLRFFPSHKRDVTRPLTPEKMHLLPHRRGPPLAELITLSLLLVDTVGKELSVVVTVSQQLVNTNLDVNV